MTHRWKTRSYAMIIRTNVSSLIHSFLPNLQRSNRDERREISLKMVSIDRLPFVIVSNQRIVPCQIWKIQMIFDEHDVSDTVIFVHTTSRTERSTRDARWSTMKFLNRTYQVTIKVCAPNIRITRTGKAHWTQESPSINTMKKIESSLPLLSYNLHRDEIVLAYKRQEHHWDFQRPDFLDDPWLKFHRIGSDRSIIGEKRELPVDRGK